MRLWLIFLESKTIKINCNRYNFFLIHHQNYSFLKSTKHLYIKPIPIIPLESKTFKCKNTWHKLAHLHPIHQPPRADENERRESLEASLVIRACNQTDEYPATLLRFSADPGQTIISAETGRVSRNCMQPTVNQMYAGLEIHNPRHPTNRDTRPQD